MNIADVRGNTALFYAVDWKFTDLTKLLIERKSNFFHLNGEKKCILQLKLPDDVKKLIVNAILTRVAQEVLWFEIYPFKSLPSYLKEEVTALLLVVNRMKSQGTVKFPRLLVLHKICFFVFISAVNRFVEESESKKEEILEEIALPN